MARAIQLQGAHQASERHAVGNRVDLRQLRHESAQSDLAAREEEADALRDAHRNQSADMVIDRALRRPKSNQIVKVMLERSYKNGNGQIDLDDRPEFRSFIKERGWLPGGLNNTF